MLINMYVIHDVKADFYHRPFYARTDNEAKRMVFQTSLDKNTDFAHYPSDFSLYCVGTFNDASAETEFTGREFIGSIITIYNELKREINDSKLLMKEENEISNEA